MEDKVKWKRILGWVLFFFAIGFFCVQMGYLLLHERYQVEYIDNRLFYIMNMLCVFCLALSLLFLLKLSKSLKIIITSVGIVFIMVNTVLLVNSNLQINNITSISPNFKHVFSVKENVITGEAIYYRSYYGILARPKEVLSNGIDGEYKVEWLADDIAAFTYQAADNTMQQFIGTYGDRKDGMSYYYVGAEIHGDWREDHVEVVSSPEGITVTENNESELFPWENIHQFGTLAVVLKKNNEAVWTIALKENFEVHSDASKPTVGNISLYKVTMEENRPVILERKD